MSRFLSLIRVIVLLWILISAFFLIIALPSRFQSLHMLNPGNLPASAFYGWTPLQLQNVLAELGLQMEMVTGIILASSLVCLVCFLGMGYVLFWQKSDTWIGLLGAFILVMTGPGFSSLLLTESPIPLWAKDLFSWSALFTWPTLFLLLYLFPNGKFVPRATRYLAFLPYLLTAMSRLFLNETLGYTITLRLVVFYMLGGLMSQIYRYRKISNPEERQQTKWIVFTLGIIFALIILSQISPSLLYNLSIGTPARFLYDWIILGIVGILSSALLPIAIGISILRYRLWDIDILIRRTLQYSLLTGLLALTYFGLIILLQNLFFHDQQSEIVIVLSTLAIAALFNPLRLRIQNFIDRRFYRKKYNAEQALAQFAATARDEVDMDKLAAALIGVVEETMQPEHVSIWVKDFNAKSPRNKGAKEK